MHRPDLPLRAGLVLIVVLATLLLGYPAAYLASHGLDARVWPALRGTLNCPGFPGGSNF